MCAEDCLSEGLSRREILLAGGLAAIGALPGLGEAWQDPQGTKPPTRVLDDPSVEKGSVTFKHNGMDTFSGYLARPRSDGVFPAVLVIAGNKISEEYIPNTCAALALAGFVGLAPNIFHPLPDDTPSNNAAYDKYIKNHTEFDRLDDVQCGLSYLRTQPFVSPNGVGVLGFCMGGRMAMLFGARSREIDAVIAFHPAPMKQAELVRLKEVPVQIHHGLSDESVSADESRKTETSLKAQGTRVELLLYEAANHGFLAYTRPFYKPDAAQLAWSRATTFFHRCLKQA